MPGPRCAVLPATGGPEDGSLARAVGAGGGQLVDVAAAEALIWSAPERLDEVPDVVAANPGLRWIQLPFAGVEPLAGRFDPTRRWTCGKGVYADPVAEHALGLILAGLRGLTHYARQPRWSCAVGRNLLGARVVILGGGEITRSLVLLLGPFAPRITVVRNRPEPLPGVDVVVGPDALPGVLRDADVLVLALALTPETTGIIDAAALAALPDHAWLVNVARGRHVDTDALVAALDAGGLAGAALDVTEPEPLPDDHPLWGRPDVLITPHTAVTPEMGRVLLARRVATNVARYATGEPLLGPVHLDLGY